MSMFDIQHGPSYYSNTYHFDPKMTIQYIELYEKRNGFQIANRMNDRVSMETLDHPRLAHALNGTLQTTLENVSGYPVILIYDATLGILDYWYRHQRSDYAPSEPTHFEMRHMIQNTPP